MPDTIIGYLHPDHVTAAFADSLVDLFLFDATHGRHVRGRISQPSGPWLAVSRNRVVETFLTDPDNTWLLFIDADMSFPPDALEKLHESLTDDVRVIGGLCFGFSDNLLYPTLYDLKPEGGAELRMTYPPNEVIEVTAGTGAAFLMIHRSVLEDVKAAGFSRGFPWFADTELPDGNTQGEDLTFCQRARNVGYTIHVHTGVKTGHLKSLLFTEEHYNAVQSAVM